MAFIGAVFYWYVLAHSVRSVCGGFVLNRFYFGPGLVWSRVRLAITTQDTNHTPHAKGIDILEGKGTQIAILLDA